jgi:hypothetical protein
MAIEYGTYVVRLVYISAQFDQEGSNLLTRGREERFAQIMKSCIAIFILQIDL